MAGTTESSQKPVGGTLQIRYDKNSTKETFLEIRAHHSSHEATLIFLMDFYKKNYKATMPGSVT